MLEIPRKLRLSKVLQSNRIEQLLYPSVQMERVPEDLVLKGRKIFVSKTKRAVPPGFDDILIQASESKFKWLNAFGDPDAKWQDFLNARDEVWVRHPLKLALIEEMRDESGRVTTEESCIGEF